MISATNKDLLAECAAGAFRERGDDILLLFDFFAERVATAYKRSEVELQDADIGLLMSHDWPGNVRELKNIAERYVLSLLPKGQRLPSILRYPQQQTPVAGEPCSLQNLLRNHERLLLEQALIRYKGDVQAVMDALDLPRRTLNEKMSRYNLERKRFI